MQKIAIIIPCFNEEKRLNKSNIDFLVENKNLKIFFVNDGSTDQTLALINSIAHQSNNNQCEVINFEQNSGKANTIYKSINQINKLNQFEYIGYFDADFSTPSHEILRIIDQIDVKKSNLVFGSRVLLLNSKIERKKHRHIIGRIIITLINLKFKLGVYDTQCGAKLFSSEIIDKAFNKPFYTSWLFDVEVFIRLKNQNLLKNAIEFPLIEWKDVDGSKLSWKSSLKVFKELLILNKHY